MSNKHLVRRSIATAVLLALSATSTMLALAVGVAPAAASVDDTISRSTILQRGKSWVDVNVKYTQYDTYTNQYGTYRRDCSGFVSMAWNLTPTGMSAPTTLSLPNYGTWLGSLDDLQPGDAVDDPDHHVVLFVGWVDGTHNSARVYEETSYSGKDGPDPGAITSTYSRQTFINDGYRPLRRKNVQGWSLAFVKTRATGSGTVEVHQVPAPYQSYDLHATTGFSAAEDGLGSFEMVGSQLVYFKTRNTATGKIELHTRGADSGFTQGGDVATVFNTGDGPNGVFELVNGDIVFIKTRNTGSGKVEVHRISGANLGGSPSLDVATIIPSAEADNGTFQMSGNDLVFIKTRNTGSGKVEVHVADGSTNYSTWKLHTATAISTGDGDNGVFSVRNVTSSSGVGDLVFVKTRNTSTGTVELFIADAGSGYQQLSLATPTAIPVGEGGNGWFNLNNA